MAISFKNKSVFSLQASQEPLVSSVTRQSACGLSSDSVLIDNSIGPNYIMYVNFHLQISTPRTSLSPAGAAARVPSSRVEPLHAEEGEPDLRVTPQAHTRCRARPSSRPPTDFQREHMEETATSEPSAQTSSPDTIWRMS